MDRKRRKLSLKKNEVETQSPEEEIAVLKQKLIDMEAELKLENEERQQRNIYINSLEQELEEKKAQLKQAVMSLTSLEKALEKKVTQLELNNKEKELLARELELMKTKAECLCRMNQQCSSLKTESGDSSSLTTCGGKNKHECSICCKLFLRKTALERHKRSHIVGIDSALELNDQLCTLLKTEDVDDTAARSGVKNKHMKKNDINEVHDDVIVEIFKHLTHNELGQISRVCKRWYELTKSAVLWRKTNVDLHWSHQSQNDIIKNFINFVPGSPIYLNINFMDVGKWIQPLDFKELCVTLQRKCPELLELTLFLSKLSNTRPSVVGLCTKFLPNLTSLALGDTEILDSPPRVQYKGTSKIRVLDVFGLGSDIKHFNKSLFSRMPRLKELYLSDTAINDDWFRSGISFLNQLEVLDIGELDLSSTAFQVIKDHGFNLKELYMCEAEIYDIDLIFDVSTFPQLETICLNCYYDNVTCEGVVSLVQSCPSLQNIYVDESVASSYEEHPFVVANKCKLGIVKFIECRQHYKKTKKIAYSYEIH